VNDTNLTKVRQAPEAGRHATVICQQRALRSGSIPVGETPFQATDGLPQPKRDASGTRKSRRIVLAFPTPEPDYDPAA